MQNRIFAGLNSEQKEAVETLEGPLLILAGAGSGKTKTLTHRIANLIAHGARPDHILAVTFTNKAAKEMRARLWRLIGRGRGDDGQEVEPPRYFMPFMGTFHSIAVRILREDGGAIGISRDFVIYDTDDQQTLIRRVIKMYDLDAAVKLKPKAIQTIISRAKNEGQTPEEFLAAARFPDQRAVAQVYKYYEAEKDKATALDFDDLMLKELKLLKECKSIREKWQSQFQYILVDEYQDTNNVQYRIVRTLVGKEKNICVVGDDWQSIYSWRGADFTNILHFERDFPGAKVTRLEQNYRSTGNILAAAQKMIQNNRMRTEKTLFTEAGKGKPIRVEATRDEEGEAMLVARKIMELSRKDEYQEFADFTILYRTNAQSYAFEKVFMNMQIPYKIVGGVRFYDRKEVKDMMAILRLVENQRDKVSLERVAKNVLAGIGEVSMTRILTLADMIEGNKPLYAPEILETLKTAKARNGLMRLVSFLKKVDTRMPPAEMIKKAVGYFEFEKIVEGATPDETEEKMKNLEVLASNAESYEELADFLADATLMSSADESLEKNSVTMMTVHASKGLEFPVVFLVGMEEGLFPSGRSIEEGDIEEERRLAYVGMTRAMRQLFLTYAESRYSFGGRHVGIQSQFLRELGVSPLYGSGYLDLNEKGAEQGKTELEYMSDGDCFLAGIEFEDEDEYEYDQTNEWGGNFSVNDGWDDDPFHDDLPVFR